jgi:hypothetical protein
MRPRQAVGVQLQAARVLTLVRCTPDVADRRPPGGPRHPARTGAAMVLSLPIPLRLLLAAQPELVTPVLQVVQRVVARHLLEAAGLKADEGHGGAVTLIQRFGSAAPHQLGAAAQACVRHRHAAPPQLWRRGVQDHRGDPRAAGHREDPDPPGPRSATAAQGSGARGGARLRDLSRAGRRRHHKHQHGLRCQAAAGVALRDLAARWRKTQGQP